MSLFGTVSSPAEGVCALIFQHGSAASAHAATPSPTLIHRLSSVLSLTHTCTKTLPPAQRVNLIVSWEAKMQTFGVKE